MSIGLVRQTSDIFFGGTVNEDATPHTYTMNLSAYFIDLKNGEAGHRLLITPLYGPNWPTGWCCAGPNTPIILQKSN